MTPLDRAKAVAERMLRNQGAWIANFQRALELEFKHAAKLEREGCANLLESLAKEEESEGNTRAAFHTRSLAECIRARE